MHQHGRCTRCGGDIEERPTTQEYRIKDRIVMILDGVPTGVCMACGAQTFQQPVLRRMESLALKREPLGHVQFVPVVEFKAAPASASP